MSAPTIYTVVLSDDEDGCDIRMTREGGGREYAEVVWSEEAFPSMEEIEERLEELREGL